MKRNLEDVISIKDIYVGLQLCDSKENPEFNLEMNFAMIQKLPYRSKTKNSVSLYEDTQEEKFYYVKKDGTVVTSKSSKYHSISFKYLKSLEEILDTCLFILTNQKDSFSSEIQRYKQAVIQLKKINFLSIELIQEFEEHIYTMYCFAYGNPIEKEMNLDLYHNYIIQESVDIYEDAKEKKKNPKEP